MDDSRAGPQAPREPPLLQRLYERPFLLLFLGTAIMFAVYTFWGLWEVMNLPQATLP